VTSKPLTRRSFLRMAGIGAAGLLAAACGATPTPAATKAPEATKAEVAAAPTNTPAPAAPTNTPAPAPTNTTAPAAAAATATPVPTAAPRIYGKGKTEVVVWYQDWDGANKIMNALTPTFVEKHPDVTINLQAIGYGDLFAKLLPSIAAGTEGDVLMLYTNWVVATDVTKVFLDITEPVGGAQPLQEKMWPAAFNVLDVPQGKIFYLPWLAGIRGACITVNTDQLKEKNIDYLNFKSYEDVIAAGQSLTQKSGDKITRAGYSPQSSQYILIYSLMWQLGGKPFDKTSGKWTFSSPEGEQAAQILYDIYWKQQTCDFQLFQSEYEAVSQKLVSIWGDGAWTASVQNAVANIPTDNIVTPKLASASENIQDPDHIACWGLSKKLANQKDKLQPAVDFALAIVSPDALIQAFDFYSGVCMTKGVYQDPRIDQVKWGKMSKRVAEGMWPIARYNQDHVADHGPASTELMRAMRKEISIKEALANMDKYLQEQEDSARERIGA